MISKSDVLDQLFAARDVLSDMIIDLQPTTPSERALMLSLVGRRDRLTTSTNNVIAAMFNEAAAGLAAKVDDLEKRVQDLRALAQTLASVNSAIQMADAIVGVVISVLALAAVA
jgi:hypothetical protein